MNQWIFNDVHPWLQFTGLVVVIAGGTAVIQAYVRRRFPRLREGSHNDIAGFLLAVIGVVYAFLVGFVVIALWDQVKEASATVRTEATMGLDLVRSSEVFGKEESDRIRQNVVAYGRASLAEWPRAASGQTTPEARQALHQLVVTYERLDPHTDTQKAFLDSDLDALHELVRQRNQRLLTARQDTGMPASLWTVILLSSALTLGFSVLFGLEDARLHYGMVATISLIIAANLFLIVDLTYPFKGELSASPGPLRDLLLLLQESGGAGY